MLCPVLVGRDRELAELDAALQAARVGRGKLLVLSGEAGIGKSRLAQAIVERARLNGVAVGTGRAVEGATQLAFRPLGEALQAVTREQGAPDDADLRPFRAMLSQFVSEWAQHGASSVEPGLVLLEGLHRLVRSVGRDHGLLLVLEDLHWADVDTLAAVEYLADNMGRQRVLCLCTIRSGVPGVAADSLARLVSRRVAVPVEVGRLPDRGVEEMARAALGVDSPPAAVIEALRRRAEGVPFLVEEMLSAYVAAGGRPEGSAEWWTTRRVVESLPPSFRDLVRDRLRSLTGAERDQVSAAAVLGRTFEWPLLLPITGLDRTTVLAGLRSAVAAQLLVSAEGADVDAFSFRHALMREAVLGELLAPERAELSHRAADAIEDLRPGLPGEWCEKAAELREQAGDPVGACRLLQESARRALARGALASAESSLHRARDLSRGDYVLWMGVYDLLCEVLARAGKTDELASLARTLVSEWERTMRHAPTTLAHMLASPRRARIHLQAARAGLVSGDQTLVRESLRSARQAASGDEASLAQVRSLDAAAELAAGNLVQADEQAAGALDEAERLGLPEVRNETLETLGRVACARGDLDRAVTTLERLRQSASDRRATVWRIHATAELGAIESRTRGTSGLLDRAHALATEAGAVSALAAIDLELAWHHLAFARFGEARRFLDNALDACEHFSLPLTPDALLALGALHALQGQRGEAIAAARQALAATSRPDIRASVCGEAEAVLALVDEDRASALTKLDEAASVQALWRWGEPWFLGLRLLLRTAAGDDNNRLQPTLATCAPMIQAYGWYTEAIRCGRAGDGLGPPTTLPAHHPARTASPHAAAEKSLERWGQIKPSPRGHFGLTQPAHSGCRSRTASR